MTKRDLYTLLRSQCCEISGLTKKQLDEHAQFVTDTVTTARNMNRLNAHHRQGKRASSQTKGR